VTDVLNATAQPCAYIRRSITRKGDRGDVSREFQTDEIRKLAGNDGPNLRIIDGDWGRSAAGEKTDKRLAFLALMDSVERGEVSTLYAYSTDRIARSIEWASRLWNACARAGTIIVTPIRRFAPADKADDGGWTIWHYEAMSNESALRGMTTKNTAVAGKRKERGDAMGRAPYGWKHAMQPGENGKLHSVLVSREGEDVQAVIGAFMAAGTYNAAAKLLNANPGVPVTADDGSLIGQGVGLSTRFGKSWDASTVRHIVRREAPELVPTTGHRGSPARRSAHMFARLLRCPHYLQHPNRPWLTVSAAPTYEDSKGVTHTYDVQYYCAVAHQQSREMHPRPYIVSGSKILTWAKVETKDIYRRVAMEQKGKAPDAETKLAELEARRAGIGDAYAAGAYGPVGSPQAKTAMAQRFATIDAEIPALEAGRRAIQPYGTQPDGKLYLPPMDRPFDWNRPADVINADLRNLWQRVELDPATMLPTRAQWTIGNTPEDRELDEAIEAADGRYDAQGETVEERRRDVLRWYRTDYRAAEAETERLRAQLRAEGKIE
jgi:DNA invertase Pin-like site-specific DNA recombinase